VIPPFDFILCAFFNFWSQSVGVSIGQSGDYLAFERRCLGVTGFDGESGHVTYPEVSNSTLHRSAMGGVLSGASG